MDFLALLAAAGIPTTQADLEAQWRSMMSASGSKINNDDRMSPFWRIFTACITNPVLWLVSFIAVTVMPNAYVKYATGDYLDLLADAVNLTRKPANFASGKITFSRTDVNLSVTVPIGTIIQTANIGGVIYQLQTTEQKAFAADSLTLDVAVIATQAGAAYNFAANYYTTLLSQISGVASVTNGLNWLASPGTEQESDDALRARIRNQFGTASSFHTDSVYKSIISQFQGVSLDNIYFVHDAPRGAGTANAYVLFDFAAPVSTYLAAINAHITDDGYHGHGDDLIVYQMPQQTQTLTVSAWHEKFLTAAEITALHDSVVTFINAAFRENTAYTPTLTAPYSRFSFSKLAEELHNQFPNLHSVTFSQADIVTGLWIPRLTSLTVTMAATE